MIEALGATQMARLSWVSQNGSFPGRFGRLRAGPQVSIHPWIWVLQQEVVAWSERSLDRSCVPLA